MALFRRKKNESVMPEEVRDFYASENRDRKGMAWVLAVITLLVTFAIAALLFFGGRWVYRELFSDDKDKSTTSQEEQAEEASPADTAKTSDNSNSNSNSGSQTTTGNSTSNGNTGTSSMNTTQSVPDTGPSELVDTGPGDENW
jgi:hypothetical protein